MVWDRGPLGLENSPSYSAARHALASRKGGKTLESSKEEGSGAAPGG
jgi:hypothetical protein